ncbi:MAG: TolC family protein [Planctomycetaceae bacterium]|jgi:cobalt-zinc-cadmium efflux system outer membrane protein|nr:TolC family protein [Planctomycetaceae bacterium]
MKKRMILVLIFAAAFCPKGIFAQPLYSESNPLRTVTAPAPLPPEIVRTVPASQNADYRTGSPLVPVSALQEVLSSGGPPEFAVPQLPVNTIGYSITELQQLALQHNPLLAKKQREIQAAHGVRLQAGLYANPTLELFGEDYYTNGTTGQQGFELSQEIIRGNKLQLSRNVANWEIEIARKDWETAQQKVLNEVRSLSFDLLATQYLISIYSKLAEIGDLSVKYSEQIVAAKEGPRISLLQNRVQRNEAIIELKKAQQDEKNIWDILLAAIGNPNLEKRNITDTLQQSRMSLNKDTVWQTVLLNSPEYRAEQIKLSRSRSVYARENAEKTANVTVRGRYGYDVSASESVGEFGIAIPLKVHDRNQGNIQRSYAEILAQTREIERKELELSQRFAALWNIYEKSLESIQLYEESILPDAGESINLSIQGLKQGEENQLELLIVQQTYFKFLVSYTETLRDLARSVTYLEGYLLEGGISQ